LPGLMPDLGQRTKIRRKRLLSASRP